MALIKSYTYTPRAIHAYESVWDSKKKQFIPIKSMDDIDVYMVLDSITLAVEAGVVDTHAWPQQFFATKSAFQEFVEMLSDYDDCYRITDQWWKSLASLADIVDEEAFVSSEEIADGLVKAAADDGLLDNWGKKKPTHKFSEEQIEGAFFLLSRNQAAGWDSGLTGEQRLEMNEATSYGARHFGFELSAERHKQAQTEGKALLAARNAKKKAVTKKKAK